MNVVALRPTDVAAFAEHLDRQVALSGVGGHPHFDPRPERRFSSSDVQARVTARWQKPLEEPGWERAWAVWEGGQIIAHVDLRTSAIPSNQHRVLLGMGVEAEFQRRGLGSALLGHAIAWAREQRFAWMDLHVLGDNAPALACYRKAGFVETGRRVDCFRIGGQSIDDVAMSLNLG